MMNAYRCAISVLVCVALVPAVLASPPQLERVQVAHWGHEKILIYAPLYIAIDGGFFEREGLEIELVYSGNDDQVFAAVLSGAVSFGVGDPAFTAVAREKGGEGKVVAGLVGRVANWGVTKNPAIQPFADASKLDGLRVTSFPSPSTTFTILSSLKQDLGLSTMEIKQLAFGTEQAAVERGEADLAIMLEPQASIAENQGYRVVWSVADYYGEFALTGVTTSDEYIARNPQTVQRFVNGLQSALTFCAKSPEASAVLLERSFPTLPTGVVKSAMERMVADETIPRTAVIREDAWLKTLKLRQTVGDLKSLDVADECLDMSFASKAVSPVSASTFDGISTPVSSPGRYGRLWKYVGRTASVTSLVAFVIFLASLLRVVQRNLSWSKMTKDERECGPVISEAFSHVAATVRETFLVGLVIDKVGRTDTQAAATLKHYCRAGLLKSRTIDGETSYEPTFRWLSNSYPLFQLLTK